MALSYNSQSHKNHEQTWIRPIGVQGWTINLTMYVMNSTIIHHTWIWKNMIKPLKSWTPWIKPLELWRMRMPVDSWLAKSSTWKIPNIGLKV
jgi:hypothetical protein